MHRRTEDDSLSVWHSVDAGAYGEYQEGGSVFQVAAFGGGTCGSSGLQDLSEKFIVSSADGVAK